MDPTDNPPVQKGIYNPNFVDPTIKSTFSGGGQSPTSSVQLPGAASRITPAVMVARYMASQASCINRMKVCSEKIRVWENEFKDLVEHRLSQMFHIDNYRRMKLTPHLSSNLLERVVNDISILYSGAAQRELVPKVRVTVEAGRGSEPGADDTEGMTGENLDDVPGTDHPLDSDPDIQMLMKVMQLDATPTAPVPESSFDKLMRLQDWDVLLDTVEKLCSFMPTVWVHPRVTGGRLHYIIYTPAHADVVCDPNNPHRAIAFWYKAEEYDAKAQKCVPVIHFWEVDRYTKLDDAWNPIEEGENKLGRLPITAFRIHVPTNKYHKDGIGDDLYEGTMELALLRTMQNSRTRDSAFKQLAFTGDPKDIPADQVMGGPSPIYLGDQGMAVVLDLQANLDQYTKLCRERGLELAAKYGITSADYTSDKVPQSGFSKKLDQAKIQKESRRRRKFFEQAEKDLYQLCALTLMKYPVAEIGTLDPDMELNVTYADPVFEEDPEKQNRIDAEAIKLGKTNIFAIWKRDHPEMTDLEILRQLKLNNLINQTFISSEQMQLISMLSQEAIIEGAKGKGQGGASPDNQSGGGAQPGDAPNGAGAGGTASVSDASPAE